ncbi:MAG: malto-oligosyltrehalose trehalohydrolase [bacterium]
MRVGAHYLGKGKSEFAVWAPFRKSVAVNIVSPEARIIPMDRDLRGYWKALVEGVPPGARYLFRLDDQMDRPDPASHFQPEGVHKASLLVDHQAFEWEDTCWRGIELSKMITYELHVGTFTREGTFEAIIPRLDEIRDIGLNTIEIMPVAQFPGERNWGYDGVYPYAVQNSYGGPHGLKKLVNESHRRGIAVILDVVYNHFGPEGNYVRDYGPYFSSRYRTPWGDAINFDDTYNTEVRNFFIENALHWFLNYHIDALRLDAIHAIFDMSARPFLLELAEKVEELSKQAGRKFRLIAENDLNDPKVIRPRELGGYGLDAHWCDDFHHALHTLLTGENSGYYLDFGRMEHLVTSLREGFVYSGQYSRYRHKNHGSSSLDRGADQMVVFAQNHDQVGNRMLGERLSTLVDFESMKLAAGVLLLSPYLPLLFMGEEYGETAPFLYFISHSDPALVEAVRKGRREEFGEFTWLEEPPDPQDPRTFVNSKIHWEGRKNGKQGILLNFYQDLITLRREVAAFSNLDKRSMDAFGLEEDLILFMRRWKDESHILGIFNFNLSDRKLLAFPYREEWKKILDSSDEIWLGPGALLPEKIVSGQETMIRRRSLAIYAREETAVYLARHS